MLPMNHPSWTGKNQARQLRWTRLSVELLESRLTLGDTVLVPLAGFHLLSEIEPIIPDSSVRIRRVELLSTSVEYPATWQGTLEVVTPARPSLMAADMEYPATLTVSWALLNTCDTSC